MLKRVTKVSAAVLFLASICLSVSASTEDGVAIIAGNS